MTKRLLFVCALVFLFTACGSGKSEGGKQLEWADGPDSASEVDCDTLPAPEDYMESDMLTERVVCTIPLYSWPEQQPDGIALTQSILASLPPGQFQRGYEHNIVGGANVCLWMSYWNNARLTGDTETATKALDYLGGPALRFEEEIDGYPEGNDPGIVMTRQQAVEKARLGDPTALEGQLRGCGPVPMPQNTAFLPTRQPAWV